MVHNLPGTWIPQLYHFCPALQSSIAPDISFAAAGVSLGASRDALRGTDWTAGTVTARLPLRLDVQLGLVHHG